MSEPELFSSKSEARAESIATGHQRWDPEKPAIGLIATKNNSDAIARAILRAFQRKHLVLVTYTTKNEGVSFAKLLGATVVDPPAEGGTDPETLRTLLAGAAETCDCSGLIFVGEPDERVDFDRSVDLASVDSVTDAVSESRLDQASVLVGIPAFNEAKTIEAVVETAREFADAVLVVDDGSEDDTAHLAEAAGAVVLKHDRNRGYGRALKTLFEEAADREVDHLVILDADGQHDPADIPKLVTAQQESDADLVIGSRFVDDGKTNAPRYRRFGISIVNILTNLSMGVIRPRSTVADTQSGFRVYNTATIDSLVDSSEIGDKMSASTDILYHAHSNDFNIEEVGTTVTYEVENASNRNPFRHGISLVGNILKTIERERPITILGIPGLISICIGLFFFYLTMTNLFATGTLPIGLALVTAVFGLFGTFATFTAIILHSLKQHLD